MTAALAPNGPVLAAVRPLPVPVAGRAGPVVPIRPVTARPVLLARAAFGQVLRAERAAQGLTLKQTAARAHMSVAYLSEVERGFKEASSEVLSELVAALGMSLPELIRRAADLLDAA